MDLPPPLSRKHVALVLVVLVVLATAAVLVLSGIVTVSVGVLGGTGDPPPQGSFHVEGNGGNVIIVRDVGGAVNASKLQIRVGGETRGTWFDLTNGSETVERGERLRIGDAESGDVVGLYWLGGGGEPKELLEREA